MREWLRTLRNEKGFTMKEMGKRLGISESYYCAIENGDRQKHMAVMLASGLSSILEVPVSEIIFMDQNYHTA